MGNTFGPTRTILFVGRPGSGKETQARLYVEKSGYNILSTGEKFRELRQHRDALGARVKEEYDTGRLLPDWIADYLTQDAILKLTPGAGIIFEGSARTLDQAKLFDNMMTWLNRPYRVVYLDITEEEARRRQQARAVDGTRPDSDSEMKITLRLNEYLQNTAPAIEFFAQKGVLVTIDGARSVEDIHADIMARVANA